MKSVANSRDLCSTEGLNKTNTRTSADHTFASLILTSTHSPFRAFLTAFRRYMSARMALKSLNEMDANQLDDIGLSRADVDAAKRQPLTSDRFETLQSARNFRTRGRRHA